MKTHSITSLFCASALAFLFTSCDSPQENAREDMIEDTADNLEDKADLVREDGGKSADMTEEQADAVRDVSGSESRADSLETKADKIRDNSEMRADQLEENADEVRDAE